MYNYDITTNVVITIFAGNSLPVFKSTHSELYIILSCTAVPVHNKQLLLTSDFWKQLIARKFKRIFISTYFQDSKILSKTKNIIV